MPTISLDEIRESIERKYEPLVIDLGKEPGIGGVRFQYLGKVFVHRARISERHVCDI